MRICPAAVLPLCLALAAPLSAQVVHGRLVDAGTGAAVASARVRLLAGDAAADSALTDSAGAFALRAEAGGIFRLAAERVGYAASVSRDRFGVLIAVGIGTMFLFHVLVNIGMTMGIMPVTGIPLPFISYGRSSLVVSVMSLGLLQSIAMRSRSEASKNPTV